MAHEYHPDKNPNNPLAQAQFISLQEAYKILSNDKERKAYDHERWLSGRFRDSIKMITPHYLLDALQKLNMHLLEIDVYRMNRQLLKEYLCYLCTDEKIAILRKKGEIGLLERFIAEGLKTSKFLPYYYELAVLNRFKLIAAADESLNEALLKRERQLLFIRQWNRFFPWLTVLITLLICIGMFWFGRK